MIVVGTKPHEEKISCFNRSSAHIANSVPGDGLVAHRHALLAVANSLGSRLITIFGGAIEDFYTSFDGLVRHYVEACVSPPYSVRSPLNSGRIPEAKLQISHPADSISFIG